MKTHLCKSFLLAAFAMLIAVPAVADDVAVFRLDQAVQVGSVKLPAGVYAVPGLGPWRRVRPRRRELDRRRRRPREPGLPQARRARDLGHALPRLGRPDPLSRRMALQLRRGRGARHDGSRPGMLRPSSRSPGRECSGPGPGGRAARVSARATPSRSARRPGGDSPEHPSEHEDVQGVDAVPVEEPGEPGGVELGGLPDR